MKKIVTVILFLTLLFSLLLPGSIVFAQETDLLVESPTPTPATAAAKVNYELVYPGILPDNPLYFIKAGRDKLVSFLINDSLKRAEFNLLTSDKRIYSAKLLLDRGNEELAITTASKSNNYMDGAVASVKQAKKMGREVDTVLHNLILSIEKHQEIVSAMEKKISRKKLPQLQAESKRLKDFEKSVLAISPKK